MSSFPSTLPPILKIIDGIEHFVFYIFKFGDVLFKILLSGEEHTIESGKNCIPRSIKTINADQYIINLQKYYSNLSSNTQFIDIFNEEKFVRHRDVDSKIPTNSYPNPSVLLKLRLYYEDCRAVDKVECIKKFPNLRYHYIDIRSQLYPSRSYKLLVDKDNWFKHFKLSRGIDFIKWAVVAQLSNHIKLQSECEKILTKHFTNNYKESVHITSIFTDIGNLYTEEVIKLPIQQKFKEFLYDIYILCFNETFGPITSLTPVTKSVFNAKIDEDMKFMIRKIKKQFVRIDEPIKSKLKQSINEILTNKAVPIIYGKGKTTPLYYIYLLLHWSNIRLMDFYTLGRMLRKYNGDNNKNRNIIFHGGSLHSDNYNKIFKKIGLKPKIEIGGDNNYETSPTLGGKLKTETKSNKKVLSKHCIMLDPPFDYVNYIVPDPVQTLPIQTPIVQSNDGGSRFVKKKKKKKYKKRKYSRKNTRKYSRKNTRKYSKKNIRKYSKKNIKIGGKTNHKNWIN